MGFSFKKLGKFVSKTVGRPAAAVFTLGLSETKQGKQFGRYVDPATKAGLQHAVGFVAAAAAVASSVVTGPGGIAAAAAIVAKTGGAIASEEAKNAAIRKAAAAQAAQAAAVAAAQVADAAVRARPPPPVGVPTSTAARDAVAIHQAGLPSASPGTVASSSVRPLTFFSWLGSLLHHRSAP